MNFMVPYMYHLEQYWFSIGLNCDNEIEETLPLIFSKITDRYERWSLVSV